MFGLLLGHKCIVEKILNYSMIKQQRGRQFRPKIGTSLVTVLNIMEAIVCYIDIEVKSIASEANYKGA